MRRKKGHDMIDSPQQKNDLQLKELFSELLENKTEDEVREVLLSFRQFHSYYRCAMLEIETKFQVLNEEFSLRYDRNPINSIHTRLKSVFSIKDKLQRKNLPVTIESIENNLDDIAGIRIVCAFCEDVYYLEKALLQQDDIELIRRKDYIQNPKENGYRSLHLIVSVPIFLSNEKRMTKVEVQIRTVAMDSWASLEHQLRYKKDIDNSAEIESELLTCAELSRELDMRMNHLRERILQ